MPSDRLRILLVSPLPPPAGGMATWTRLVMTSRLAAEHEIRVLDTAPDEKAAVAATSRFRFVRASQAIRLLLQFLRELIRFRPQLVHVSTSYHWALLRDSLFVLVAWITGARTLLQFHGGDFPESLRANPRVLQLAIRFVLRRSDRLLVLDRHTETFLCDVFGPDVVRYLPNFVRPEEFGGISRPGRESGGRLKVLYVGWILEAKGIRELLAAARALDAVHLTMVGPAEPVFVGALRTQLAALGDRVRLLAAQPHARIRELYTDADVFVLPSWREGFPNVILEAMAAGLPVVATPVGAVPEVVRHGKEGLLVPPRDAEALRSALETLLRDPEARQTMARSAHARVRELFAMDVVLARLSALYVELGHGRVSSLRREIDS